MQTAIAMILLQAIYQFNGSKACFAEPQVQTSPDIISVTARSYQ